MAPRGKERQVQRDPDGARKGKEQDRECHRKDDGDHLLPDQVEPPEIGSEKEKQCQTQAQNLSDDKIERIGAKEVSLFPLETDPTRRAGVAKGEIAVKDAGATTIRTPAAERPALRHQKPFPGLCGKFPQGDIRLRAGPDRLVRVRF